MSKNQGPKRRSLLIQQSLNPRLEQNLTPAEIQACNKKITDLLHRSLKSLTKDSRFSDDDKKEIESALMKIINYIVQNKALFKDKLIHLDEVERDIIEKQIFSQPKNTFMYCMKKIKAEIALPLFFEKYIAYANHSFGPAESQFGEIIAERKKTGRVEYEGSKADRLNTGNFISAYYPYPVTEKNRDQLIIDTVDEYRSQTQNSEDELYQFIDMVMDINNLRILGEKIHQEQTVDYDDPSDQQLILDNYLELYQIQVTTLLEKISASKDEKLSELSSAIKTTQQALQDEISARRAFVKSKLS